MNAFSQLLSRLDGLIFILASRLGLGHVDGYIIFIACTLFVVLLFLTAEKLLEFLVWLTVWISVYIVTRALFSSDDPVTGIFANAPWIPRFFIGTSVYFIIIVTFLTPFTGILSIKKITNKGVRTFETILLALFIVIFCTAILFGFIEKKYIFQTESMFGLIANSDFYKTNIVPSVVHGWLTQWLSPITMIAMFYTIYRVLFHDIVSATLNSLLDSLKKMKKPTPPTTNKPGEKKEELKKEEKKEEKK